MDLAIVQQQVSEDKYFIIASYDKKRGITSLLTGDYSGATTFVDMIIEDKYCLSGVVSQYVRAVIRDLHHNGSDSYRYEVRNWPKCRKPRASFFSIWP